MRTLALALLVPATVVLAGCPGPDDPEDVDVPPAAEQVQLEQLQGSGVSGEVAVTARDNETHLVVMVRGAAADESLDVRLHSGTCQNPGPEIRNIGTIRTTDMGEGAIETTIGEAPATILDGNHVAVIWGPTDDDRIDDDRTDATTTDATRDDAVTDQPDPDRQDTGLVRDDRRAVACTALPRHTQVQP